MDLAYSIYYLFFFCVFFLTSKISLFIYLFILLSAIAIIHHYPFNETMIEDFIVTLMVSEGILRAGV